LCKQRKEAAGVGLVSSAGEGKIRRVWEDHREQRVTVSRKVAERLSLRGGATGKEIRALLGELGRKNCLFKSEGKREQLR